MAFCTNCGTQLDDGVSFCTSCGTPLNGQPKPQEEQPKPQEAQPQNQYYQPQPQPQPQAGGDGVYGIGGAITSAILSFVGFIFSIVTYIMGMSACLGNDDVEVGAMMFGMASLGLCLFGLILGVKSIGNFKKGRALGKKPIGTLIVGIGGTALSGFGLLFAILGLAMGMVALL